MKFSFIFLLAFNAICSTGIYKDFSKELSANDISAVRKKAIEIGPKSVADLIKVINDKGYPLKSKWHSIFLIGQIIGDQSIPYLEKISNHKNWMLRLASLKTIAKLNNKTSDVYKKLLKDKAMIVRFEALDSIERLKLSHLSKSVWNMLYDDRNYSKSEGKRKRSDLIKKVIKVVGNLKFEDAKKPLLKMVKDQKYNDIFTEIDYSLAKIMNKKSKGNTIEAKRLYWKVQSI